MMPFFILWLVMFIVLRINYGSSISYLNGKIEFSETVTKFLILLVSSACFSFIILCFICLMGFMEPRIIPKIYRPPFTKTHEEIADKISKTINEIW